MNKLLFLLLIVLACVFFGNVKEGLQMKGVMGLRQYIPIPQHNTGPFMHPVNNLPYSSYEGHNAQLGF